MGSLLEITLGLLLAVGLLCLGWALFGKLLTPVQNMGAPMFALVKGEGDGEGLEHTLACLVWLRGRDLAGCPVLLVDAGLNEEGLHLARLLCSRWPAVEFCRLEDLPERIQGGTQPEGSG